MATEVPRYLINTPYPGAFVEGIGILRPGTEIDLPEKMTIGNQYHPKADKHGSREVTIEPRETWWPLNDAAWEMFEKYMRTPKTTGEINVLFKGVEPEPEEDPEETARKKAEHAEKLAALRKRHASPPPPAPTAAEGEGGKGKKGKGGRAADQAQ